MFFRSNSSYIWVVVQGIHNGIQWQDVSRFPREDWFVFWCLMMVLATKSSNVQNITTHLPDDFTTCNHTSASLAFDLSFGFTLYVCSLRHPHITFDHPGWKISKPSLVNWVHLFFYCSVYFFLFQFPFHFHLNSCFSTCPWQFMFQQCGLWNNFYYVITQCILSKYIDILGIDHSEKLIFCELTFGELTFQELTFQELTFRELTYWEEPLQTNFLTFRSNYTKWVCSS